MARELRHTNTLIGSALRLLTDDADNETALKTSLATLTRVLDAVHWLAISKGNPEAWLYFYEDFLRVYDNDLRKKTGSYYTPPEVVRVMVRLVDEALRSGQRFALSEGLASPDVTVADPATGTGTFLLGVLRRIAQTTGADQGPGAVPAVVQAAVCRLIGFEMQFGPFAVAQLRIHAELRSLLDDPDAVPATRLFVTDTLGNPYAEEEYLPQILLPLGESRQGANAIKRQEKVTVVIGNPPYKEKAKGLGGWIESGSTGNEIAAPLRHWMPPADWNVGAHAKHLRNLYVYFWRWATWKVFGDGGRSRTEGRAPGPPRHRLIHHRGGLSERTRLSEDARGAAPGRRRDLDQRLLAGGASAGCADTHLPGRAAARVHRHGASEHRCGLARPGAGPIPGSAAGTPKRQVRGARRDCDRRRWVDRMPIRPPRLVLPPIRRGVGRVRGPGRPVRLRRLRRHAGTNLGDRARSRLAGATMGGAAIRSRCREETVAVPSASSGWEAGRQACPQVAAAGAPWS